jgi:hypothetical protein
VTPVLPAIHVAAVGDARDEHELFGIVHCVHDSVITDANSEIAPASELHRPVRAGLNRKFV